MLAMVPLTGDTGWDHDDVSTGQGKLQSIVLGEVAGDFLLIVSAALTGDALGEGHTYGNRGDVGEICSDAGGVNNIVKGKLVNKRASLQQEGERLYRD
jgi:hypothetical protein